MNTSITTTTSGAKAHFLAMVRKARELGQVFLITHRGEESAVLLRRAPGNPGYFKKQ